MHRRPRRKAAGDVAQHVDPAPAIEDRVGHGARRCLVQQVGLHRKTTIESVGWRSRPARSALYRRNPCTCSNERVDDRAPEIAARAGDHRNLVGEFHLI